MATYRVGSKGVEVARLQARLAALGYDPGPADGDFGGRTRYAVRSFQRAQGIEVDGAVGPETWRALFGQDTMPESALAREPLATRCLIFTGVIETGSAAPQCFSSLSGDFDGMGISFGVCQWCLGAGSLQPLLAEMFLKHGDVMSDLFDDYAGELRDILSEDRSEQLEWARGIQTPGFRLVEPWQGMFRALGQTRPFQEIQKASARHKFQAALDLCREYGLFTERAAALMYDIKVQNGSIKPSTKAAILQDFQRIAERGETGEPGEVARLRSIAERRAAACLPRWAAMVRTRKLTIVNGEGVIHGSNFHLAEQYGITLATVPELRAGPLFREAGFTETPGGGAKPIPAAG